MELEEAIVILNQLLQTSYPKITLTDIQLFVFQRCWAGDSYQKIAADLEYEYNYIKQVGSQLWQALSAVLGQKVSKSNLKVVFLQYQQASTLSKSFQPAFNDSASIANILPAPYCDWGEAIDVSIFFDRVQELATLSQWVNRDRCRLITLLGMGGIGKTALSVKFAQELAKAAENHDPKTLSAVQAPFRRIIWRSLRDAPPLPVLLTTLLQFLAEEPLAQLPESVGAKLSLLVEQLRQQRCLIVLDNFDALLEPGKGCSYRNGYENYGELLQRVGEIPHQSCMVITSREKPQEVVALAGDAFPTRVLHLQGLQPTGGQALLQAKGLSSSVEMLQELVTCYRGNPLALKIAATSIQDLFSGNITAFLQQGTFAFSGINQLLQQQIRRLSALELQIMHWLTINRESVSVAELQADLIPAAAASNLLNALETLCWRSLVEKSSDGFTQQPVVMEYMTERIIEGTLQEIVGDAKEIIQDAESRLRVSFLQTYALVKATAKDYVRDSQVRMLLQPLITKAVSHLHSEQALRGQLYQRLDEWRSQNQAVPGYVAGNVLNILRYLNTDLTGADFSYCQIRQAYLSDLYLQHASFAHSEIDRCVFAETFGGILSVAFSPDGERLAIADSNGEIRLWYVANGQPALVLKAHDVWTWSVTFSPDGRLLASASDDHLVKIWDSKTGELLHSLRGHTHSVITVTFSPDGQRVATGSEDGTIRLWNIRNFEHADRCWQAHDRRVWAVLFSANGKTLASSSEDHTIKFWDLETGSCIQTLSGHNNWVKAIAFHPNGQMFASGSHDQTLKLWDLATRECLQTWTGHTNAVTAIAFAADGQQLISSSHDQTVKIWHAVTGQCLKTLQGHSNRLWSMALSANGQLIASGGDDHAAKLWDTTTGQCTRTFQGHTNAILSIALSPDRPPHSTVLASGHEDETVKLWDLQTDRVTRSLRGHRDRIWSVAFAPLHLNVPLLASGSGDETVKLWNWQTGECLRTLTGHESWVWSVVFHPQQPILASGSYDTTVKLWDLKTGDCRQSLCGHQASVIGTTFSPDGKTLVSCGFDKTIRLWNLESGQCDRVLEGHTNTVWQTAFSPDGQRLASCSYDHTVKLWDVQTGTCLQTLAGHGAPVISVAFSPNGDLVSGGFDQTVRYWNLKTGECLKVLQGHHGIVASVLWADDLITSGPISSGFDETIKFWNPETGDCLKSLRTPRPYEGLNIVGIKGLTSAQRATLEALGAIERDEVLRLVGNRQASSHSTWLQGRQ
ncbi:MAG: NB-ARC domain-containing protein [Elainellaceae cyanobacterium]